MKMTIIIFFILFLGTSSIFYKKIKFVPSLEHFVCEPSNVAQSQIFGQIQHFWPHFLLKEGRQKRARRDGGCCQNDAVDSALEKQGLGASFEGYYIFVGDLDVVLTAVKDACTTPIIVFQ